MPRMFPNAAQDSKAVMKAVVYAHHGPSSVLQFTATQPRPRVPQHFVHAPQSRASEAEAAQEEPTTQQSANGAESTGQQSPPSHNLEPAPSSSAPPTSTDRGPRSRHVLVKVCASGLNPLDVKFRKHPTWNMFLPKPKIPGSDLSGVVVACAKDSRFRIGDRVFGLAPTIGSPWGSCAEYYAVPEQLLSIAPKTVPLWKAAALPLVALTVIQGLRAAIQSYGSDSLKDKTILIHGGSGGVGTFAIAYCKRLGLKVITTCSGAKAEMVRALGADQTIDYKTQVFEDELGVDAVDIILDPLPYIYEKRSLKVLKSRGHYIQVVSSDIKLNPGDKGTASFGMGVPEVRIGNLMHLTGKKMWSWFSGPHFHYVFVQPDHGGDLEQVAALVDDGKFAPVIDKAFPLEQTAQAHDYLEAGHGVGKVVIMVNEDVENQVTL